ncbi:MAG TPA: RES domain-containing protein [Conexibacter sp.]|nr:RES domain-containing protein [Conexibacter sp.]
MGLIVDQLLRIPAGPCRITVFRTIALTLDGKPAEDFVPDPSYAKRDAGRWATPDGTLYTACTIGVTWNEYCRWSAKDLLCPPDVSGGIPRKMGQQLAYRAAGPPPPARALVRLEFDLQRVPDLTLHHVAQSLLAAQFDVSKLRSDDHDECRTLSAVAALLGWDAMVVPSAATDQAGRCVPVFKAGRGRLIDWEIAASPASPTLLHALETRYRQGERPGWLKMT